MAGSTILDRSDLLGKRAAEAAAEAIESSFEADVSVVYAEGDTIVREHPDGRREVLGRSEEATLRARLLAEIGPARVR